MLNEIRYELGCVIISKKLKKIGFISIRKSPSWAKNLDDQVFLEYLSTR